jgi:hypothetical protein
MNMIVNCANMNMILSSTMQQSHPKPKVEVQQIGTC